MALSRAAAEAVGTAAAVLTTAAFLPQAWKTWRSRSAADLSYAMLGAFSLGLFLWLLYGILLESWPIIVANAVTLALNLLILGLKVRYAPPAAESRRV
jgi:MtN3 and saliva related transmembrane protein